MTSPSDDSLPLLALSPVTISQCPFPEAFEVAAKAGFQGIGLRYDRFEEYLGSGGRVEDVKRLAADNGLRFTEAGFLAEWQFHRGVPLVCQRTRSGAPEEAEGPALARLERFLETCVALDCDNITAAPTLSETGSLETAAEDFGQLCDRAHPHGLRVCLEFMGSAPQIRDVATAFEIVERANRPNGGLLIDTFLFHEGDSTMADLARVPVERIFNVQLADAKSKPRAELNMLEDRVFPGEGVAPVREVVATLAAAGYQGPWTVELFNPEYRTADPQAIARKAFASAEALFPAQA